MKCRFTVGRFKRTMDLGQPRAFCIDERGGAHRRLGATMGGLAVASALGQTLGSAAAGWLFGALAQLTFAWLAAPLLLTLMLPFLKGAR